MRRFLVADMWSTDRCDGVLLRSVRTAPYLDWFFGFIKALLFSLAKYEASIGILALKQRVHSQKILKSQMMARRAEVEIMLFYRCSLLLFSWYLSFKIDRFTKKMLNRLYERHIHKYSNS